MTKQLARYGIAVMTTLLALAIFWQFRIVIVYLLISLTLAAALRPVVKRLVGRGFLGRSAWILLYLVVLVCIGFLLYLISRMAFKEIQLLAQTVSVQDTWKLPVWLEGSSFQQVIISRLPHPSKLFEAITGEQGQLVLPTILGVTLGIADFLSATIVILFLTFYWILNQINFERLWLSLLPSGQRAQARDIWHTIEPDLGSYIRGQFFHSLLAGILFGLGYWALGSPSPVLLALAGALACLIPVVGVELAVIPPLLFGLLTGVQLTLFMVIYTIIVLIALGIWVKPRLFNRTWDNPILTLILLIALANAFGLLGVILAPPFSAICQILWSLLFSHRLVAGNADSVSDLIERQERVLENIKEMEEPPIPLVTSSIERLTQLINKAGPLLEGVLPVEPSENVLPLPPLTGRKSTNDHP
jgi:predicted PurR-regulated permease PerM